MEQGCARRRVYIGCKSMSAPMEANLETNPAEAVVSVQRTKSWWQKKEEEQKAEAEEDKDGWIVGQRAVAACDANFVSWIEMWPMPWHFGICARGKSDERCNLNSEMPIDKGLLSETGVTEAELRALLRAVAAELQERRAWCYRTCYLGPLCPPCWWLWLQCDLQCCCSGCCFQMACVLPALTAVHKILVESAPSKALKAKGVSLLMLQASKSVQFANNSCCCCWGEFDLHVWAMALEWASGQLASQAAPAQLEMQMQAPTVH